ncbi:cell division protein ZipA [Motiliproteus sp. MSK22-1]|uniref:cell division protein ZipA n=1 Tax=Motiliproteus sp. MSK22-1 TaxID=1897630 RepID=UPI000975A848|nr:cell division protein ZipA [Motiliproteus sp. MSK22-1]OMH30067.1 cell division protein ZipA [Motiliproteus sp. MSK22-1]
MSERDWLIVAGVVVLILIVLDGVRRMRNRNKLRLDIDSQFNNLPEEDFHGELPNGGARVAVGEKTDEKTAGKSVGKTADSFDSDIDLNRRAFVANSGSTDRDIDLLMDAGLKGVGQGADRWLDSDTEEMTATPYLKQHQASDREGIVIADPEGGSDYQSEADELAGLAAENRRSSGQADELQTRLSQSRFETPDEEDDALSGHPCIDTSLDDDLESLYSEPSFEDHRVDRNQIDSHRYDNHHCDNHNYDDGVIGPARTKTESTFASGNARVSGTEERTEPEFEQRNSLRRPDISEAPLSLVEDDGVVTADGLDLSQPVTVLMEQMRNGEGREYNSLSRSKSSPTNSSSVDDIASVSVEPFSEESVVGHQVYRTDSDELTSEMRSAADKELSGYSSRKGMADESGIKADSFDPDMEAIEAEFGAVAAYDSGLEPTTDLEATTDFEATSDLDAATDLEATSDLEPTAGAAESVTKRTAKKRNRKSSAKKEAEAQKAAAKPAKKSRISRLREEIQTSFFDLDPDLAPEPVIDEKPTTKAKKKQSDQAGKKSVSSPAQQQNVEQGRSSSSENVASAPVLVINVAGRNPLPGKPLFRLLEACAMEFGDMNIFHRYEDGPSQGAIQFSMANAIKPGYFDLSQADHFETPAVTFFLDMSEPRELMNAFDCMLATAQCVADNLDGQLKDENRSVMRSQTIEHYRQEIRDYERRRLAKRA